MLDRRRAVDALHDQVGLVERLLDVALANLAAVHLVLEMGVPVALGVDLGGVRVERLADVEEGRTLVEVCGDRLDGGHRRLLVGRRNDRDRLTEVADLVLREQRLVGRDPEGREVPVLEQRNVLPGDHVHVLHRLGLARVEIRHRGVVHGRAKCLHPERARHPHVVDEHGVPRRMGDTVIAGYARADRFHATPPRFVIAAPGAVTVRSNESPRATAATASMIFT